MLRDGKHLTSLSTSTTLPSHVTNSSLDTLRFRLLYFLIDTYDHDYALHLGASMDLFYLNLGPIDPGVFTRCSSYKHSLGASLDLFGPPHAEKVLYDFNIMYSSTSLVFTRTSHRIPSTVLILWLSNLGTQTKKKKNPGYHWHYCYSLQTPLLATKEKIMLAFFMSLYFGNGSVSFFFFPFFPYKYQIPCFLPVSSLAA